TCRPIIGLMLSVRVATNPACHYFRHHHRSNGCRYCGSSGYPFQQKHWIEARCSYRDQGSVSIGGLAARSVYGSSAERKLSDTADRRDLSHFRCCHSSQFVIENWHG